MFAFQYKYRDLTVRQTVNVIAMYKDLKPVLDSYGKYIRQKDLSLCLSLYLVCVYDYTFHDFLFSLLDFQLKDWVST